MDLSLDRASEVPLGTQLIWKLRTLIAVGTLAPGSRLPGIRELAEAAGVNVNTVRAAVARLEEQGLLASEHGRGTFVSGAVQPDQLLLETRDAAIASARAAGIDPRALAAALFISGGPAGERAPAVERDVRRALRAEIAALEGQLGKLDPLGSLDARPRPGAARLLTAQELTVVRDELASRVAELHRERAQYLAQQEAAERAELEPHVEPAARWRIGGVWTGRPAAQVSWTAP